MYSRGSRYRHVAEEGRTDPSGRVLRVTGLRLRVPVEGRFRHTVESGDRLDHLAQRYYGRPRDWWRIADANPEFASPLALLGRDVIATVRLEIGLAAPGLPPWSELLRTLRARPGVEDAGFEDAAFEDAAPAGRGEPAGLVTVIFNRLNDSAGELAAAAEDAGFPVGAIRPAGRTGKPITVPPAGS